MKNPPTVLSATLGGETMKLGFTGQWKPWAGPVFLLFLVLPLRVASAATFIVGTCQSGTQLASISAAITAAAASAATPHNIRICPGTYNEGGLTLNNSRHNGIAIESSTGNRADVTIAAGSASRAFDINGRSDVTLRHLTITGNNQGVHVQNWSSGTTLNNLSITTTGKAVETNNVSNFTLTNSTLIANNNDAIDMEGDAGGVTIDNVTITAGSGGSDSGIEISRVYSSLSITRVTITRAGHDGIQIGGANSLTPTFRDLQITATRRGITANDLRLDLGVSTLAANTITAGQVGIHLAGDVGAFQVRDTTVSAGTGNTNFHGIHATGAYNVWSVRRSKVSQAGGHGIFVTGGSAPVVEDVEIAAHQDGIHIESGNGPVVRVSAYARNQIVAGQRGVYFFRNAGPFKLQNTTIIAGSHGLSVTDPWNKYEITDNTILSSGGIGLDIAGTGGSGVNRPLITGNVIKRSLTQGMRLGNNPAWAEADVYNNCFYNSTNIHNNYRSATFHSGVTGNYWGGSPEGSGYSDTCTDANSDGICDMPYSVPGAGGANMPRIDSHPLKTCRLLPPPPLHCFTDRFSGADEAAPGSDWTRTSSSGSFGLPRIVNNRLRMTNATGNVATAAHLQRRFPGAGNRIVVEFDLFAYGGNGADGIVLAFSDATVTPQAGAYGGSLGYAQRSGVNGFTGGWLGVGFDEFGNFAHAGEGRVGGPGRQVDSVTVRGSGSGTTGYRFHAGSGTLSPGVDQPGAAAGPNHRYRVTIDNRNNANTWVSVERNTGGGFATIIPQYDARAQAGQAAVPEHWLLSYTASTGGAHNIHEIDNLEVCTTEPILPITTGPHHIRIEHPGGSGVTCAPTTLTLRACANETCSSFHTGGIRGTLTKTGSPTVNWPDGANFVIPPGASSTTARMHVTTAGNVVVGATAINPPTGIAPGCNFGSPQCTFTSHLAGFLFDVPDHHADTPQTVMIAAVRQSNNALACTPAFSGSNRTLRFGCSRTNPASGTLPVVVGGTNINCGTAADITLGFDPHGVATTTVRHADVGALNLTASFSGSGAEAGLSMSGSDNFIAAPARFAVTPVGPYVAGRAFAATVVAQNTSGATTPNFGRESAPEGVRLSRALVGPTDGRPGDFGGSVAAFSGGSASGNDLIWDEVGDLEITATLQSGSYLGSGLTASGSAVAGAFRPAHFTTAVTPGMGTFTYAGQPFEATVTALNAAGAKTWNYRGSYARAVTLADANAALNQSAILGSLSNATLAAADFVAGEATTDKVAYVFANKTTAPLEGPLSAPLAVRATDADGVNSQGRAEGVTAIRAGRLRLHNAFGAATSLRMEIEAQYWSGRSWVKNAADSTTSIAAANIPPIPGWTITAPGALSSGAGFITLHPGAAGRATVCVDLAGNGSHCAASPLGAPWLQSNWGGAASHDVDPSATATFGIRAPEHRGTIHIREAF